MTMSNHEHVEAADRQGTRVVFYQYLHELVARAMNCLRGRFENFWAAEQTSVVRLVTVDDVVEKVVYSATNPVTAGLVARVDQWPGVNTLKALLDKKPIVVNRPRYFFSEDMPETVTLTFRLPPELGDEDEILGRIRRRVAEVEAREAAARATTGRRVLGRRAVRQQSWRERPRTHEPRFGLRPQVACRDKWRASRPSRATSSSSRPTPRPATSGSPASPPSSRPARTGSATSPSFRSPHRPNPPSAPSSDRPPAPQVDDFPARATPHAPSRRGLSRDLQGRRRAGWAGDPGRRPGRRRPPATIRVDYPRSGLLAVGAAGVGASGRR